MVIDRDEDFEAMIGPICEQLVENEEQPSSGGGLLQGKLWRQKREAELRDQLYNKPQQERIERGMRLVDEYLPRTVPPETEKLVRDESGQAAELFGVVISRFQAQEECTTLADQLGLSDTSLAAFYAVGSQLYDEGSYREAADVFFVCVLLNPLLIECWQALGLSYQQSGSIDLAEEAFRFAHSMLPEDPINALYFVNSLILNDHWEEANSLLRIAEALLRQKPQGREWEDYLASIKQRLLRQK